MVKRAKFYLRCWRDKILRFVWPRAEKLTEIEDFMERHGDAIAKAIEPVPFKHTCPYPPGSKYWHFDWRFPFVHQHVYRTTCLCDIIHILDSLKHNDEVINRARHVIQIDLAGISPAKQLRTIQRWREALRRYL
jgi:hypothetical protein